MKVLHLINTLSAGGAELHLLTLCRHLKRHGVDVVVACLREHVGARSLRCDFETEQIRIINLEGNRRYGLRYLARIARALKEERPDVLHTHLPRADLAGAFVRFLFPRIVWICSVHDIYSYDWSGRWTLPLFSLLWRRADTLLCISGAVKEWLMKRGIPPANARIIYYGIEPEDLSRAAADLRQAFGLNGGPVIGSIGRLEARKGHERLIEAMPKVCERVPAASLLIAGHDPWGYGKNLLRLIRNLGLEEKVRLVGFENDIVRFLGAIDVFAFASNSEGFGQVVIEAMAAGKPVVATKIPPLTETIVTGETGLLVEPERPEAFADAISWLLAHPGEAQQMGRRGQERVRNFFSAERMVQETLKLYIEVLDRRRSSLES